MNHVAVPPRYTIEERDFRRDSLTTGIGVPTGVYLFTVKATVLALTRLPKCS